MVQIQCHRDQHLTTNPYRVKISIYHNFGNAQTTIKLQEPTVDLIKEQSEIFMDGAARNPYLCKNF
jgi:hypothetical protein